MLCPPNADPDLLHTDIPIKSIGRASGHAWEQLELPRANGDRVLVNLCNMAPLISSRSITMIHDAQVFSAPSSYSLAFRNWYKFAQPIIGRRAKNILTVSNFSAQQLTKYNVAKPEKISVVHNGVDHILRTPADLSALQALRIEPGAYTIALASTQAHKNIRVLVEAFRDHRLSNRKLVLFGGAKIDAFEAAGMTLPDNVILTGRISDGALRALIEGARALLFPSKTEGFGLPPLEAMLLGTPAICSPSGALPEVCGDAALYADADLPEAWIEAVLQIYQLSESAYSARVKASRERAAEFTWIKAAEKLRSVIDSEIID